MWVDEVRLNYSTVICILRLPLAKYNCPHSGEAGVLYSQKQGLVPSPVFREQRRDAPRLCKGGRREKVLHFWAEPEALVVVVGASS